MPDPIRVVYFVSNYHRFTGSQRSLYLLVRGLPRGEVSPLVVFPGEGACSEAYRAAGIPVEILKAPPALDRFGGGLLRATLAERARLATLHVPPFAARFARLLRRERAQVAHFNNTRAMLLGGLGAEVIRTPKIWHLRSDERGMGMYAKAAAALADRIICVADGVRSSVPAPFVRKCRTVYNGIDPPTAEPARDRAALLGRVVPGLELAADDVLLVAVGSIIPFKGIHHLLDAAKRLLADRPEVGRRLALVLVGDEPYPDYGRHVRAMVEAAPGVRVRFAGWDDQPLDWMRAADAVVLPTIEKETVLIESTSRNVFGTEGFSRTVLEAMACARPVVATRVAGVPEQVVHGETGLLCPPSDPRSLAESLETLIEASPAQRRAWGEAGRARVLQRFSVRRTVEGTIAVYRELAR